MKKVDFKHFNIIYLISIIFMIILFIVWQNSFKLNINISKEFEQIDLFSEYRIPNYNAEFCIINKCKDITNRVKIKNNVNTNKTGKYKIQYKVKYLFKTKFKIAEVNVINDNIINESKKDIENYIESNNYKISLGYVSLNNNYTYKYKENTLYFGASLIKTLDALYIYEKTNINDKTRNLVKNAISISDNESHYELLDIIGYNNLKNYGIELGALNTLKGDKVNGYTTVNDQIIYLKHLYEFVNSNDLGEELKNYFINDYGLRLNFNNDLVIMHKFGHYDEVFHDVGIVLTDEPYIVIILTKESKNDYSTIIRTISEKIYNLNKIVTS